MPDVQGLALAIKEVTPDIVALDLNLGPDVKASIKKLKEQNPILKILTITAFAASREGLMDADEFLDKINLGEQLLPFMKTLSLQV